MIEYKWTCISIVLSSLPTTQQLYETAMQGTDLIIRSNLGFSVLKDTSTCSHGSWGNRAKTGALLWR